LPRCIGLNLCFGQTRLRTRSGHERVTRRAHTAINGRRKLARHRQTFFGDRQRRLCSLRIDEGVLDLFNQVRPAHSCADTRCVAFTLGKSATRISVAAELKGLAQGIRRLGPIATAIGAGAGDILLQNVERRVRPTPGLTRSIFRSLKRRISRIDARIIIERARNRVFARKRCARRLRSRFADNAGDTCDPDKGRNGIR